MVPISATSWRDGLDDNDGWLCKPEGAAGPLSIDVEILEKDPTIASFCPPQGSGENAPRPYHT